MVSIATHRRHHSPPADAVERPGDLDWLERVIGANNVPEDFLRFQEAARTYVEALGKKSWEECLNLSGGTRTLARTLAQAKRTAACVDAFNAQKKCSTLSDWRCCEILSVELADFERECWPMWQGAGVPSMVLPLDRRRALHRIFAAMPEDRPAMTTAGIYALLKRTGALN